MWQGTFTFQEPWDHRIRQVPIRMCCGLVVFRDRHSCKVTFPHSKSAKGQLFGEKVVQLSELGHELWMQICLHEFSCPIIYVVLQFFLLPNFFIFDFFFVGVPIPEGEKIKCHEEKKKVLWMSIHSSCGRVPTCLKSNRFDKTCARTTPFETLKNRSRRWCHCTERDLLMFEHAPTLPLTAQIRGEWWRSFPPDGSTWNLHKFL